MRLARKRNPLLLTKRTIVKNGAVVRRGEDEAGVAVGQTMRCRTLRRLLRQLARAVGSSL